MTARRVVRVLGVLLGIVAGLEYSLFILANTHLVAGGAIEVPILCMLAGAIFGYFGLEYVTLRPFFWTENKLRYTPLPDLLSALAGLVVGLVLAALAGYFLRSLPYALNIIVGAATALLFGYWGVKLGLERRDEIVAMLRGWPVARVTPTIIDTSAVIDGRLIDIAHAGFIRGRVVAPHFMLAELQAVADSPDSIRRQRGRRGLEIIDELRSIEGMEVEVTDHDYPEIHEVDHKLIRVAKEINGAILTTDYNLNRVAQLEGVPVLNINDLSNALKAVVVPGEELVVALIKEGKEHNQGVGYLADGTMVVVEGGRRFLGQTMPVTVTSLIQTAAGRMIFAKATTTPAIVPNEGQNIATEGHG